MNKSNYLKFITVVLAITAFVGAGKGFAAPKTSNKAAAVAAAAASAANAPSAGNNQQNPGNNGGNEPSAPSKTSGKTETKSGYTIKVFDPFLDNHLKAPPDGIRVGKFGQKIKEVETELRAIGAKNHSYAFGKYSKMLLSSYQITLNFDVNKRLGMVEIEPRPPLKTVEPKAREFFIKFFTEGADLSQIGIAIKPEILEMKFISPY